MNSLVTLPIVAAVPTAAPAMEFPLVPVAPSIPASDLKLVELAEKFIAAVAESRRLNLIAEQIHADYRMSDLPSELRVRPSDANLGRTLFEPADEFWHRPCDIDQWRNIHKLEHETEHKTDGFVLTVRRKSPQKNCAGAPLK